MLVYCSLLPLFIIVRIDKVDIHLVQIFDVGLFPFRLFCFFDGFIDVATTQTIPVANIGVIFIVKAGSIISTHFAHAITASWAFEFR